MRACLVLLLFLLAGCVSHPPVMYPDNFIVRDVGGVEITYPYVEPDPVQNGTFRYEVADAKISVRRRRFYVDGAYRRSLHRGDHLEIPDRTVLLNGQQILP